jgi:hypothetical protein
LSSEYQQPKLKQMGKHQDNGIFGVVDIWLCFVEFMARADALAILRVCKKTNEHFSENQVYWKIVHDNYVSDDNCARPHTKQRTVNRVYADYKRRLGVMLKAQFNVIFTANISQNRIMHEQATANHFIHIQKAADLNQQIMVLHKQIQSALEAAERVKTELKFYDIVHEEERRDTFMNDAFGWLNNRKRRRKDEWTSTRKRLKLGASMQSEPVPENLHSPSSCVL